MAPEPGAGVKATVEPGAAKRSSATVSPWHSNTRTSASSASVPCTNSGAGSLSGRAWNQANSSTETETRASAPEGTATVGVDT